MSLPNWHKRTLLGGVVGSTAYGMSGPNSDRDYLGMYAASFEELASLRPPFGRRDASLVSKEPDLAQHEALKFCQIALGCNPTLLELLWLDEYEVLTDLGRDLIEIRTAFLSQRDVRNSYMGYAEQQFRKLLGAKFNGAGADSRKQGEKHARHLVRLTRQGVELYSTGRLTLRLGDPEKLFDLGRRLAAGDSQLARDEMRAAAEIFDRKRSSSPLPQEPDREKVQRWLFRVRFEQALLATG